MRTRSRLLRVTAAATVASVTMALSLATAASATPRPQGGQTPQPGQLPTAAEIQQDRALMQRQAKLDAFADALTGTSGTESEHSGGYAGAVVDAKAGKLTIYWHGSVPSMVDRVVAEGAAAGLTVSVVPTTYSAHQLEVARRKLEQAIAKDKAAAGPLAAWNAIAVAADGSGLNLTYDATAVAFGASTAVMATDAATLASVPVRVSVGSTHQQLSCSHPCRQDDGSPYWAGAAVDPPAGAFCSTAFTGTYNGIPMMLTASHCGTSGTYYTYQNETQLGGVYKYNTKYDTSFIRVGAGQDWYYDGAWDSNWGKKITSWALNHDGDYVCTSGAMSGVHCYIQVTNAGVDVNIGGIVRSNVVLAMRTSTDTNGTYWFASAEGDSGGPVVASPDGTYSTTNMQARGIISGANGDWVVCDPNLLAPIGRNGNSACWQGVAFIGMSAIVNTMGFHLYTS